MFTGIVRERGVVRSVERIPGGLRLRISASETLKKISPGDSIAVDGVCQTVVTLDGACFSVEALPETLARTTLGGCRAGQAVNLEPALGMGDLLGGHLVCGHVDGVGHIKERLRRAGDILLRIQASTPIIAQVVERGSVAVDGVSLTVTSVGDDEFTVALIPYTLRETTLASKGRGDPVNVETDMIVKVVQRLLGPYWKAGPLSEERLRELGF